MDFQYRISCPNCSRTYSTRNILYRHLREGCGETVTDNYDPLTCQVAVFRCPSCPYRTFTRGFLRSHKELVHGNDWFLPFETSPIFQSPPSVLYLVKPVDWFAQIKVYYKYLISVCYCLVKWPSWLSPSSDPSHVLFYENDAFDVSFFGEERRNTRNSLVEFVCIVHLVVVELLRPMVDIWFDVNPIFGWIAFKIWLAKRSVSLLIFFRNHLFYWFSRVGT